MMNTKSMFPWSHHAKETRWYTSYGASHLRCGNESHLRNATVSIMVLQKWRKSLEDDGFVINPYNLCVANKVVNGKQLTVVWHVDDAKISHVDPDVVTEFIQWTDKQYGDDELGRVVATRGKVHEYLAMILDFSTPGMSKLEMT